MDRPESTGPGDGPARQFVPGFVVVPDPPAARPGDHVTVSTSRRADGGTVTDCSAGFSDRAMFACRKRPNGWAADVVVPPNVQIGPGTMRWRIAYRRTDGGTGSMDGLATFTVLNAAPAPAAAVAAVAVWGKRLQVVGGSVLGAVLLALPFAFGGTRALIRRRWRRWRGAQPDRPEDIESADQVEVTPIADLDPSAVVVREHDRWPVHLICSLAPIDPHLEEYP